MDLVEIDEGVLREGAEQGLAFLRNVVSPDAIIGRSEGAPGLMMDPAYGTLFDRELIDSCGLYGRSSELPTMPEDQLANRGFLRVPYRRVPRRLLSGRDELDAITAGIETERMFPYWRGQSHEYLLERLPATRWLLYGETHVLEPSLLTSAGRRGMAWERVLQDWAPLVRAHLDQTAELADTRRDLYRSYRLRALLLALAQHYGLPSCGLDVTPDLQVGLFFALHEFEDVGEVVLCRRKAPGDGKSVLYLLVAYPELTVDYDKLIPSIMTAARPQVQQARFLATAWGYAPNACARSLVFALYLDPALDWGDDIPTCEQMFPSDDRFGNWLLGVKSLDLSPGATRLLSRYKPIVPVR